MRPTDGALLIAALLVEAALVYRFWQPPVAGAVAVIETPEKRIEIDLREDGQLTVQGAMGPSTLEVTERSIRFIASPCRRKVCIRSGTHRHAGASTACVPNQISVSIAGSNQETFDAIHF